MKNFKILSLVVGMLTVITVMAGCGSSSPAPLDLFAAASSGQEPQLNSIVSGTFNTTSFTGFSANNAYWLFTGGFSAASGNYLAPADGIVSDVETATVNGISGSSVTIIHSGDLATRVYGIQLVNVQIKEPVLKGSPIGTYITTGQVAFQVLFNGIPVCPLSYVSSSFRSVLASSFASSFSQLCQ